MEQIRVFSAFHGAGGTTMQFDKKFEIVAISEFHPDACAQIAYKYPTIKNFGDITKIIPSELPDFDLMTFGFPCFEPGTMILTKRGALPIEEVVVGDLVLTHTGSWKTVLKTMNQPADHLRTIKGMGILPTRTTDEHPYYTRERINKYVNRKFVKEFKDPSWVDAKDLQKMKHYACQILPAIEDVEIPSNMIQNEEFWWIVGRFIADGWIVGRYDRGEDYSVKICCGKHEKELVETKLNNYFPTNPYLEEERTVFKFSIYNKEFARWLVKCGKGAVNKQIPAEFFGLKEEYAKALLEGYFQAMVLFINKIEPLQKVKLLLDQLLQCHQKWQ